MIIIRDAEPKNHIVHGFAVNRKSMKSKDFQPTEKPYPLRG